MNNQASNPAPATLKAYTPPKMQYKTLLAKARMGADNVVSGVEGVPDARINAEAKNGWIVVQVSFVGRKKVAVFMEKPIDPNAKPKKTPTFSR